MIENPCFICSHFDHDTIFNEHLWEINYELTLTSPLDSKPITYARDTANFCPNCGKPINWDLLSLLLLKKKSIG